MRVLENFLSCLMRDGQRLRDFLQATLEQRGFQEAHLEAHAHYCWRESSPGAA